MCHSIELLILVETSPALISPTRLSTSTSQSSYEMLLLDIGRIPILTEQISDWSLRNLRVSLNPNLERGARSCSCDSSEVCNISDPVQSGSCSEEGKGR